MSGSLITEIFHPFGKGTLTAGGAQYGTLVTSISTTYTSIGSATITLPTNASIVEVEIALMGETISSSSSYNVLYKGQASDAGTSWDDITSEITRTASCAALADFANVLAGRPSLSAGTYFKGATNSFQVRVVAKISNALETASGAMKNSSYIIVRYRLL